MRIEVVPVYYPEDYYWWRISLRREVGGVSLWLGNWRRVYIIRNRK